MFFLHEKIIGGSEIETLMEITNLWRKRNSEETLVLSFMSSVT